RLLRGGASFWGGRRSLGARCHCHQGEEPNQDQHGARARESCTVHGCTPFSAPAGAGADDAVSIRPTVRFSSVKVLFATRRMSAWVTASIRWICRKSSRQSP